MTWNQKKEAALRMTRETVTNLETERHEAVRRLAALLAKAGVIADGLSMPPPTPRVEDDFYTVAAGRLIAHAGGLRDLLEPFDSGERTGVASACPECHGTGGHSPWCSKQAPLAASGMPMPPQGERV